MLENLVNVGDVVERTHRPGIVGDRGVPRPFLIIVHA